MPTRILVLGVLLVLLGVGGYFGTGRASVTALIPSGLGVLLILCGVLARLPSCAKAAVWIAHILAIVAASGAARGVIKSGVLTGQTPARPAAVIAQAVLFLLSVSFLILNAVARVKSSGSERPSTSA